MTGFHPRSWLRVYPILRRKLPGPRRCRLEFESLEARILFSASLPLNPSTWTALGPAPIVNGQVPVAAPVSGRVTSVAPVPNDPNTLYIGTAGGGVWKTSNAQAASPTWTPLTDSQAILFIGAVAVSRSNTQVVYAGTGEANGNTPDFSTHFAAISGFYGEGILKSSDSGASWTLLGSQVFFRHSISKIVVDPTNANIVYAAVGVPGLNGLPGGQGIWKSMDGGNTWVNTTLAAGIPDTVAFSDLVINPMNPLQLFAAAGDPNGNALNTVYVTTMGGNAWARSGNFPMGNALGRIALTISTNGMVLDAIVATPSTGTMFDGSLSGIEDTVNGGVTWNPLNDPPAPAAPATDLLNGQGNYDLMIALDPADATNNTIYVGGAGDGVGAFISATNNAGAVWTFPDGPFRGTFGADPGPHADIHGAAFDAMNRMIVATDGGVWRLDVTDSAGGFINPTWTNLNGNLNTITFFGASLSPTDPNSVIGGSQDNGTELFTDTGAGAAAAQGWRLVMFGDGGTVRYDPTNPNTVYAEVNTDNPLNSVGIDLMRSDNGGQMGTFNNKTPPVQPGEAANFPNPPFVLDPNNPQRILLGTSVVYESLNRGDSWIRLGALPNNNAPIDSLAATSDPNVIYVSSRGRIFVTLDHGASWTERDPILPQPNLRYFSLVNDPRFPMIAYVVAANFGDVTGGGHVWRTTNGGVSWSDISGDLPNLPVWSITVDTRGIRGNLYVGTDTGVYQSINQGLNWTRFGGGLPNVQVRDLQLNPTLGILLAGTHGRGAWEIQITPPATGNNFFAVGADAGGAPQVIVYSAATGAILSSFFAFAPTFTGGVRVAVADINGDGTADIICAAGPGGGPQVEVIDGTKLTQLQSNGQIANSALLASFFAFTPTFSGGVYVAAAVSVIGTPEVVVGAGAGGGPQVEVLDGTKLTQTQSNGQLANPAVLTNFFAFVPTFTGGVRVAIADVNGDGTLDIICGAGPGGGPQVIVIDGTKLGQVQSNGQIANSALLTSFFSFATSFTGGVFVSAGATNGSKVNLIVSADASGGPQVEVISGTLLQSLQSNGQIASSALLANFFAFPSSFTGGVRLGFNGSFGGNSKPAILTAAGPGASPEVAAFNPLSQQVLSAFFALPVGFAGGSFIAG